MCYLKTNPHDNKQNYPKIWMGISVLSLKTFYVNSWEKKRFFLKFEKKKINLNYWGMTQILMRGFRIDICPNSFMKKIPYFTCHMSLVTYCMPYITYLMSYVTCKRLRVTCHISCVTCDVSHVTRHMSHVTCHLLHVMCHMWPITSPLPMSKICAHVAGFYCQNIDF